MDEKITREFTRDQLNELRLLVREGIQGADADVRGLAGERLEWASEDLQHHMLEEARLKLERLRALRLALA